MCWRGGVIFIAASPPDSRAGEGGSRWLNTYLRRGASVPFAHGPAFSHPFSLSKCQGMAQGDLGGGRVSACCRAAPVQAEGRAQSPRGWAAGLSHSRETARAFPVPFFPVLCPPVLGRGFPLVGSLVKATRWDGDGNGKPPKRCYRSLSTYRVFISGESRGRRGL